MENYLMKPRLLLATLILVLASVNPLFAREKPADVSPLKVVKAALRLTEDQVTELRGLLQVRADEIAATTDQINMLQAQLKDIFASGTPDPAEVGELVLETRALREEIGQYQEDFKLAFEDLLTPEQHARAGRIHGIALATKAAKALSQLGVY